MPKVMTVVSRKSVCKFLLDLVYGNFCPCCKKAIGWNELVCSDCKDELEKLKKETCNICGHIVCKNHEEINYDNAVTVFLYDGLCRDTIYKLKNNGEYNFAEYSADLLSEKIRENHFDKEIDLITAVPMYHKKKGERGYNQAEIIAKFLSRQLNILHNFHLLARTSDKSEQHKLNANQRKEHAEKIYKAKKHHADISGKTILLVDDVLTSGSTMNKCSSLLKKMGAKKVICTAIAVSDLKILEKNEENKEYFTANVEN